MNLINKIVEISSELDKKGFYKSADQLDNISKKYANVGSFLGEMASAIDMADIRIGLYKSLSFGLIVSWISCYKGFNTNYGAEGVSKATIEAVVASCVLILVWNYFLTSVLF